MCHALRARRCRSRQRRRRRACPTPGSGPRTTLRASLRPPIGNPKPLSGLTSNRPQPRMLDRAAEEVALVERHVRLEVAEPVDRGRRADGWRATSAAPDGDDSGAPRRSPTSSCRYPTATCPPARRVRSARSRCARRAGCWSCCGRCRTPPPTACRAISPVRGSRPSAIRSSRTVKSTSACGAITLR